MEAGSLTPEAAPLSAFSLRRPEPEPELWNDPTNIAPTRIQSCGVRTTRITAG
jgi:hypothetical protein